VASKRAFFRTGSAAAGVLAAVLATSVAAGCAPLPTAGPPLAVSRNGAGSGGDGTAIPTPGEAPKSWSDSLSRIPDSASFSPCPELDSPVPDGVTRECMPFDPAGQLAGHGQPLYAALLTSDSANRSKPPLVISSGPDRLFSAVVDSWARTVADGLSWPVLVVEPRTQFLGRKTCDPAVEEVSDTVAAEDDGPDSPTVRDSVAALARGCQDGTGDMQTDFDASGHADDLASLATKLGLEHMALGGTGAGASAAALFATAHPEAVAAFLADSPTPFGGKLEDTVSARAEGSQMALAAWLADCRASRCLGDTALPGGSSVDVNTEELSARDAAALRVGRDALSGVTTASPSERTDLYRILAGELTGGSSSSTVPASDANTRELFTTCLDNPERPAADALPGVLDDLGSRFPTFGREVGARAALCSDWPVVQSPDYALPAVPTLVTGTTAGDPLAGSDPAGAGSAALTAAGAASAIPLRYGGYGSVAVGTGRCIADGVQAFLDDPAKATPTACPA